MLCESPKNGGKADFAERTSRSRMGEGRVQAPTQHDEAEESERKLHGSKDGHNPQGRRRHSQQRVVGRPGKKQKKMADWNELNELLVRVAVAHGRGAMYAALTTKEQQAKEKEKARK